MKNYIGTKQIQAKPMTRQQYNDYRGWKLPDDEDGTDEGYLVEYLDGGESNHPDHDGYISWAPKAIFEKSYQASDTPLQRVRLELTDLSVKLTALVTFLNQPQPSFISDAQWHYMRQQRHEMGNYKSTLCTRIKLMEEEDV